MKPASKTTSGYYFRFVSATRQETTRALKVDFYTRDMFLMFFPRVSVGIENLTKEKYLIVVNVSLNVNILLLMPPKVLSSKVIHLH